MTDKPELDVNAPMDAPIKAREARERHEAEQAAEAMQRPEVQAALGKIVRESYAQAVRSDKPELDAEQLDGLEEHLRGCPTSMVYRTAVFIEAADAIKALRAEVADCNRIVQEGHAAVVTISTECDSLRLSLEAARGEIEGWRWQYKAKHDAWDHATSELSAANAKLAGAEKDAARESARQSRYLASLSPDERRHWCLTMAEVEGDSDISAGLAALVEGGTKL